MQGAETFFDIQRPNHAYVLDLSRAAQYALAGVLVRYWRHEGPATWQAATLDGAVRNPCFTPTMSHVNDFVHGRVSAMIGNHRVS